MPNIILCVLGFCLLSPSTILIKFSSCSASIIVCFVQMLAVFGMLSRMQSYVFGMFSRMQSYVFGMPRRMQSYVSAGAPFEGAGGRRPPRQKKKRKKEKKKIKEKEREKGTMNNVKLLHIKCCFFKFFNSPVALKNLKKFWPPKKKLK